MNNYRILKKDSYPFLPDLNQNEIFALQKETAIQHQTAVYFRDSITDNHAAPEMAVIPAGHFEMGSDSTEFGHRSEEAPPSYITIKKAFAIGRYTITANEFDYFRQVTEWTLRPELIWAEGQYPVINIRARDAKLYAKWLSQQTGHTYRLPTEAEWEYAARAGTSSPFYFGDSVSCKEINFDPTMPYNERKQKRKWYLPRCVPSIAASEVGIKPANTWGLYDMHGNVWEFTDSIWRHSHVGINRDGSSQYGNSRWIVTKGGSWFDAAVFARSAARKKRFFDEMDTNLGFRLVRELE